MRNLSNNEMVQLSGPWVEPGSPARAVAEESARLAPFLPNVNAAHRELVAVQPALDDPRLSEIAGLSAAADAEHDRLARGVFGYLSAAALLDADGEPLLGLRDLLFPEGVGPVIHASYRDQAGYAARLRERLSPELRASFSAFSVRTADARTLADWIDAWLASADRLGKLQDEAARIDVTPDPSEAARLQTARNQWIRTVNAFTALADFADLDVDSERTLFGPLRAAEADADRRAARRRAQSGDRGDVVQDESRAESVLAE